jgi:hypothetical protein
LGPYEDSVGSSVLTWSNTIDYGEFTQVKVKYPTAAAVPAGVAASVSRYPVIVWAMGAGPLHIMHSLHICINTSFVP